VSKDKHTTCFNEFASTAESVAYWNKLFNVYLHPLLSLDPGFVIRYIFNVLQSGQSRIFLNWQIDNFIISEISQYTWRRVQFLWNLLDLWINGKIKFFVILLIQDRQVSALWPSSSAYSANDFLLFYFVYQQIFFYTCG